MKNDEQSSKTLTSKDAPSCRRALTAFVFPFWTAWYSCSSLLAPLPISTSDFQIFLRRCFLPNTKNLVNWSADFKGISCFLFIYTNMNHDEDVSSSADHTLRSSKLNHINTWIAANYLVPFTPIVITLLLWSIKQLFLKCCNCHIQVIASASQQSHGMMQNWVESLAS